MGPTWPFLIVCGPVWSLYNIGTGCHEITQVVFWVELSVQRRLCPIFVKSWVLGKGDSMEWCRVTRHPRILRGLMGCQRTPEFSFPASDCWAFVLFFISPSFIMLNFIGRCGENIIWYHFFYIIIIILKSQFLYIFCLF